MLVDNNETQKRFPALGTKLFFHANSAKKKVLLRQLTALSRARKRRIITNHIKLLTLNNQFC